MPSSSDFRDVPNCIGPVDVLVSSPSSERRFLRQPMHFCTKTNSQNGESLNIVAKVDKSLKFQAFCFVEKRHD